MTDQCHAVPNLASSRHMSSTGLYAAYIQHTTQQSTPWRYISMPCPSTPLQPIPAHATQAAAASPQFAHDPMHTLVTVLCSLSRRVLACFANASVSQRSAPTATVTGATKGHRTPCSCTTLPWKESTVHKGQLSTHPSQAQHPKECAAAAGCCAASTSVSAAATSEVQGCSLRARSQQ
jgi:hypothetical protein